MNTELPTVLPSEMGDVVDPAWPIMASLSSVTVAHRIEPHRHRRGQLIYASHGTLQVMSQRPVFMVPPQFAVWIPPSVEHSVSAAMPIDYCSLFIDTSASQLLPKQSQLLHLTTLLKELTQAVAQDTEVGHAQARMRLSAVILDQLQRLRPARVALPMPNSARLYPLVEHLLHSPGQPVELSDWAARLAMSARTLTRLFRQQTGLTLGQWVQHLKVLKAIERLQSGESVKAIAFELGYQQSSAFISMFKRVTGQTPTDYIPS